VISDLSLSFCDLDSFSTYTLSPFSFCPCLVLSLNSRLWFDVLFISLGKYLYLDATSEKVRG